MQLVENLESMTILYRNERTKPKLTSLLGGEGPATLNIAR